MATVVPRDVRSRGAIEHLPRPDAQMLFLCDLELRTRACELLCDAAQESCSDIVGVEQRSSAVHFQELVGGASVLDRMNPEIEQAAIPQIRLWIARGAAHEAHDIDVAR